MLLRADYLLLVLVVGAIAGWLIGRGTKLDAARLARAYLLASIATLSFRVAAVFVFAGFGSSMGLWPILRDLGSLAISVLIGLIISRRARGQAMLREPAILDALCWSTGVWFVTGGIASMFVADQMVEFFQQSGYSAAFFRVIVLVEIVGGMALLVRRTVPLGLAMLVVDMFGAIVTHARNADGIDADVDALAMLVRLGTLAVVWQSVQGVASRRVLAVVITGAVLCLIAAIAGSYAVARLA